MKGILTVVLVILAGLVLTADALLSTGENVCRVPKTREQTYTKYEVKKTYKITTRFCFNYRKNFRCEMRTPVTRRVPVQAKRLVRYVTQECCAGWRSDNGRECLKAVCSGGCRNHEDCVEPGVCRAVVPNLWTSKIGTCRCYFNNNRNDCACCVSGGCQCTWKHPNKCVQCGYGSMCEDEHDASQSMGIDAWTLSESGCSCSNPSESGTCPCCKNKGCPCPSESGVNRCVQCGAEHRECSP